MYACAMYVCLAVVCVVLCCCCVVVVLCCVVLCCVVLCCVLLDSGKNKYASLLDSGVHPSYIPKGLDKQVDEADQGVT